ncbi:hypothetical protein ACHAWF_009154 [Thalassiosira exigua]
MSDDDTDDVPTAEVVAVSRSLASGAAVSVSVELLPLPDLRTVWDCDKIRKIIIEGKDFWECLHCPNDSNGNRPKPFKGLNATKVIAHVCRIPGYCIRACKGIIQPSYARRNVALRERMFAAELDRQARNANLHGSIVASQDRMVQGMAQDLTQDSDPSYPAAGASVSIPRKRAPGILESFKRQSIDTDIGPPKKKQRREMGQLKLFKDSPDPEACASIDIALADLVHSLNLSFMLPSDPKMRRVLDIARTLPSNYKPPGRGEVGGRLLTQIYDQNWKESVEALLLEAQIFGISMFGDGATIQGVPLVNALANSPTKPFTMLDCFDCTDHCAKGKKKDAKYIAGLFLPLIKKLETVRDKSGQPYTGVVDMVFFDGASNVQKAGQILAARNPRISVGHGAEHVVSLFFADCFKYIPEFKRMAFFCKKLRNVFGSVRHKSAAIFKKYSAKHNRGIVKDLSNPLNAEFKDLNQFGGIAYVILKQEFWNYFFLFSRALYAPMRLLHPDMQTAAMDKLMYYFRQTKRMLKNYLLEAEVKGCELLTDGMIKIMEATNDDASDGVEENEKAKDGGDEEENESEEDAEDEKEGDSDEESVDSTGYVDTSEWFWNNLLNQTMRFWIQTEHRLEHDYAYVGHLCAIHPAIIDDANKNRTQQHDLAVDRLITKLLIDPTVVGLSKVQKKAELVDLFWKEHAHFVQRTGPFNRDHIWIVAENPNTEARDWHRTYSLRATKVLGKLACLVTSKILGTGSAERHFKLIKGIKKGPQVNTSTKKCKMKALIYGNYSQMKAVARRTKRGDAGKLWDDQDFECMKMDTFCGEMLEKVGASKQAPSDVNKVLRAWEENWEKKKIGPGGDEILEARLIRKYEGLQWLDPDNGYTRRTSHPNQMYFNKARGQNKYYIIGAFDGFDFNKDYKDQSNKFDVWEANDVFFNQVTEFYAKIGEVKMY